MRISNWLRTAASVLPSSTTSDSASGLAFLRTDDRIQPLGNFPAHFVNQSVAHGINRDAMIVGWAAANDNYRASYWSAHAPDVIHLLFSDDTNGSVAYDVNDAGHIIGTILLEGASQAYLYDGFVRRNLGYLNPVNHSVIPTRLNSSSQVVGYSAGVNYRAFLWDTILGIQDLNNLVGNVNAVILETAMDINDLGQIVGSASIHGRTHAYVLTPIQSNIPEPSTPALLLIGALALWSRGKLLPMQVFANVGPRIDSAESPQCCA